VVSKWVGETEKNLEAAFREAEESQAVLFFDEAEALFGRRAEVQHGTDRYANLEVSYLLQRLENSLGLVILASNVKDQIDPAFTRRFQVVMHFAKPARPNADAFEYRFPKICTSCQGRGFGRAGSFEHDWRRHCQQRALGGTARRRCRLCLYFDGACGEGNGQAVSQGRPVF